MNNQETAHNRIISSRGKWTKEKIATAKRMTDTYTAKEISEAVGLSIRAVYRFLDRTFPKEVGGERLDYTINRRGPSKRNNQVLKQEISRQLSIDCTKSLKELSESISPIHPVSPSVLSRVIKEMGWTRKRVQKIPYERNSERIISDRRAYALSICDRPDADLIFLDETGFNLHVGPVYGWSPAGTNATTNVPTNRGCNVSVIAAIGINGLLAVNIITGSFNATLLVDYLTNNLFPVLPTNAVVIMDNARFHHSGIVQEVFREHSIQLKFLPAYSPELNPIEEVFSMVKNRFRAQIPRPTNSVELVASIETAFASITQVMLQPFYNHSREFLTMAINLQPFI